MDRCGRCGFWLHRASASQHAALQAVLEDIALQLDWPQGSGNYRGPKRWWPLIVAAFDRLHGYETEILPAIDGIGFDGSGMDFVRDERLRRQVESVEISEIIEYTLAWGVERGVKFREFKKKMRKEAGVNRGQVEKFCGRLG